MISLVIPICNEKENLGPLSKEIAVVALAAGLEYELIYVDDGSNDGSWRGIL